MNIMSHAFTQKLHISLYSNVSECERFCDKYKKKDR